MTERDPIASFYHRFPYPLRAPETDGGNASWALPACLPAIAHHVFGGTLPTGRPLRLLVAGGGTGDAVVSLGGWLRSLGIAGSIDYLDLSEASCAIARQRAAAIGLDNVTFRLGPLEALADESADRYDYVDFCGVVNHVESPGRALAALAHAIAPGGGIGVMAYGKLGRSGVYEAQAALAMLGVDGGQANGVALARAFLGGLSKANPLRRNPAFDRLAEADDAEIADVLLNPRDRAFSTDDLGDLCAAAGLRIGCFAPAFLYDPLSQLREPALQEAAGALTRRQQWRLAELLQGTYRKHVFYAVKPAPGDPELPDARAERLLDEAGTILIPAGVSLPDVATSLSAMPDDRRALRVVIDGRTVAVASRLSAPDLDVLRAINGPTRVGDVVRRLSATVAPPLESVRRVQRRLTQLGLLYVAAG